MIKSMSEILLEKHSKGMTFTTTFQPWIEFVGLTMKIYEDR